MSLTARDDAPSLQVATPSAGFHDRRDDGSKTGAMAQHECNRLVPVGAVMLPVRGNTRQWQVCGDLSVYLTNNPNSRSAITNLPGPTDKNFVNLPLEFDFDAAAWHPCDGLLVLFIVAVTPPGSFPESALTDLSTASSPDFDEWKRVIEAALKNQGARPLDGGVLRRP